MSGKKGIGGPWTRLASGKRGKGKKRRKSAGLYGDATKERRRCWRGRNCTKRGRSNEAVKLRGRTGAESFQRFLFGGGGGRRKVAQWLKQS